MLRIVTWNVNGLRAAIRKGFDRAVARIKPDVLLLQEVRATPAQLGDWAKNLSRRGWHCHWHPARKLGYAGTAVLSRVPMVEATMGLGLNDEDPEGRVALALLDTEPRLRVASIYLPSGSSGDHRQEAKEAWMPRFRRWAGRLRRRDEPVLLAGDLNIAISPMDIFYARNNENTSGYLPHERAWMRRLVQSGWRDLIREAHPDGARGGGCEGIGPFTWWSNRGQALSLDRGWRIDYLLANEPAAGRIMGGDRAESEPAVRVHREAVTTTRISDHAPVSVAVDVATRPAEPG